MGISQQFNSSGQLMGGLGQVIGAQPSPLNPQDGTQPQTQQPNMMQQMMQMQMMQSMMMATSQQQQAQTPIQGIQQGVSSVAAQGAVSGSLGTQTFSKVNRMEY